MNTIYAEHVLNVRGTAGSCANCKNLLHLHPSTAAEPRRESAMAIPPDTQPA